MQLKHISKILVQISPLGGHARSAREFLARATSRKSLATNPQCDIKHNVRRNGDDFVEVTFASGQTERIYTKGMNIGDILSKIDSVAEDMDMQERLKAAGLAGIRLTSTWQQAEAGESDLGVFTKEPRQA